MAVELEEVVRSLSKSGLMTADEVSLFISRLPEDRRPADARQLIQEMVRQHKLTKFQAQAVYQGKTRGLVLGNYVVLDKIGEGGMGQVFKARHQRMERVVALKLLPPAAVKSEDTVRRFQREVKAAARLSHPNIVTAYDADEAAGLHFLVMEYVEGTDLASLVQKDGPLSVDRVIGYCLQAARGLEYAHSQNIIHRDIKPSNLFLDKAGTVKILDMGLARIEETTEWTDQTVDGALTREGMVLGTVDYMSPEQGLNTKNADARSDIYSLGCTLYWLLTGQAAYGGDTLMERIVAHREKPIPSLRQAASGVPHSLDAVFQKMVAKRAEERQQTMSDVVAALERCDALAGSGRSKPAAMPKAGAETLSLPTRTVAAPTLRPRPRVPATRPRRDPLEEAKKKDRRQKSKDVWAKTVEAADRDYRRRHGLTTWSKVKKVLGRFGGLGFKLVVVVGILGGGAYGGLAWWKNSQRISQCRERIVKTLNPELGQRGLDMVSSAAVSLADVSVVRSVPEELSFEAPIFQTAGGTRRRVGTLKGGLNRASGALKATIELFDSPNVSGQFRVEPVP
jgi:serine/threonine protein kinase